MFGIQHKPPESNSPPAPPSSWSGGTLDMSWYHSTPSNLHLQPGKLIQVAVTFGSGPSTTGLTNVVAIAANEFPLLALKADRTVAGGPASPNNVVAVAAARYDHFALKTDGTVVTWLSGNPIAFTWPTNVVVLASGQNHRLAILGDGQPPAPVPFTDLKRISNSFNLTVPTQYGHLYWLDYKTSLADTNWRALPQNPGIGNPLILTDTVATNTQRFYRIRQSPALRQ
jgi:hypothetical protein